MPEFEVIQDLSRLQQIEAAWSALADLAPHVTPFQLPHWQLTWWRHFASGQLEVLCWWEQGSLVGIIPCFLHQWAGRRQLTLIGSGISDYLEPLILPKHRHSIVAGLQDRLWSNKAWDICNWQDLSVGTPLSTLANNALEEDTVCSEVLLTGGFEEFWGSRSKDLRRNLRRYTERAYSMGPLSFQAAEEADENLLNALIDLHAERWGKRGEAGTIAANNSASFLRDVALPFSERGTLRIFAVIFREQVAAIVLTFLCRNTVYSYLSAFDPQHEILGFGRILLYDAFQYSYANGYRAWNFCRGDEPYKSSWGAQPIAKRRLIIARDTNLDNPQPCVD